MAFDNAREKRRASAAYRLTMWRDKDGKLPLTIEGIGRYKKEVENYEREYGTLNDASRKQFENLCRSVYHTVHNEPPSRSMVFLGVDWKNPPDKSTWDLTGKTWKKVGSKYYPDGEVAFNIWVRDEWDWFVPF